MVYIINRGIKASKKGRMINMRKDVENLVAACGLYCGACRKFKQGNCSGCQNQSGTSHCGIRPCVEERGYTTCAECDLMIDCKIRNNLISRVFGFIFRTDKKAMLSYIQENGLKEYAERQEEKQSMRF